RGELALSSGTVFAERRIIVPGPAAPLPDGKLAIDASSLSPKSDLELRAGDWWTVRMKATRRRRARFRVGKGAWREMREVNASLGLYEAVLQVAAGEEFGPETVEYAVGGGWSSFQVKGTALVSASARTPAVAVVKANPAGFASVKTGPNNGFLIFPQPGTRFLATGREGGFVRVALGSSLAGWIDARDVDLSTGAAPPHAVTGNIGVTGDPTGAAVRISLTERVPFTIEENAALDGLTLRIFSSVGHTNWVTYEGDSNFIEEVRWSQEATDIVAVTVRLKPGRRLWGWNAHYDAGASLKLDLRRPPQVSPANPLAGLKVMLDPGHMPSATGATGPMGTKEMDANYAIAQSLAEILTRDGAVVLVTRSSPTEEVSLSDRPRQAVERGADLFVSIHNNALPDGSNPFAKPRGFTVFYYHTHSLALGRALHAAYRDKVPLPDEGLQWGNLLVARLTAVPAVLIENAHMIMPDQEARLNDPAFRNDLAKAMAAGLRIFMREAGEKGGRR
ncbi:MAG: N-acetylmuramoyl-L-alanine amidase, partial [Elusimicrobiota bacterium]